jgi:hypothetical protein
MCKCADQSHNNVSGICALISLNKHLQWLCRTNHALCEMSPEKQISVEIATWLQVIVADTITQHTLIHESATLYSAPVVNQKYNFKHDRSNAKNQYSCHPPAVYAYWHTYLLWNAHVESHCNGTYANVQTNHTTMSAAFMPKSNWTTAYNGYVEPFRHCAKSSPTNKSAVEIATWFHVIVAGTNTQQTLINTSGPQRSAPIAKQKYNCKHDRSNTQKPMFMPFSNSLCVLAHWLSVDYTGWITVKRYMCKCADQSHNNVSGIHAVINLNKSCVELIRHWAKRSRANKIVVEIAN